MIKIMLKKLIAYVKKNIFACACFLLAIMVFLTGSVSYSRYISTDSINKLPGAGSFSCSANIDGVSALSFTNTAFWGGTVDDDKIAMNALRSINFSVNNFNVVGGVEQVAEVKMNYNLSFSAPMNFVKRLAIQPFTEDEHPMLPQLVLIDLINAGDHHHIFHTANSDDFNSVYHHDLTFNMEKSGNNYTATFDGEIHDEPVKVVIKLEEHTKLTHQLLHFRSWDTSSLTSEESPTVEMEGGKLLPPIQVKFTREIPFYRVTISMSNMVLPAGVKTTKSHSIRLAPTDTIEDDHLAGYFVSLQDGQYLPITSIYGAEHEGDFVAYTMQTVKEQATDSYYTSAEAFDAVNKDQFKLMNVHGEHAVIEHDENIMGSVHHYIVGEKEYFENTTNTHYLENGSFSHDDREYIDGKNIYLKRTGNIGNYTWQLIGVDNEPANMNDPNAVYYKLFVKYGEIINRRALKLTKGTLKTEIEDVTQYKVKSVEENADNTHNDIVLNVTSHYLLRYSIDGNASGTETLTQILDIEEEGLVLYSRNNYGQWVVDTTTKIHTPNLTILPYVAETINHNNVNNKKIYEKDVTEYIIREIERDIRRVEIDVEEVKTTIIDGEGKPVDVYYTQSAPLNFFEDGIQKIYLSQCYSKNYPFYVNVVFEQVL